MPYKWQRHYTQSDLEAVAHAIVEGRTELMVWEDLKKIMAKLTIVTIAERDTLKQVFNPNPGGPCGLVYRIRPTMHEGYNRFELLTPSQLEMVEHLVCEYETSGPVAH